jgi:ATP-binding cassette subfamily B protein
MREYLPVLIVGGIIGTFTLIFVVAYAMVQNKKEAMGFERNMADSEIIRRLLSYAKPYWKQFVLTLIVMLFSVGYDVISPLLVGRLVGMIQEDFVLKELFIMVAVYASILVVSLLCTYTQAMLLQKTGQKILSQIRLDVFTHIESLSHDQLNNIPVGTLVTRVSNDPNAISFMFTNILVTLVKNILVVFGVLGAMLMLN